MMLLHLLILLLTERIFATSNGLKANTSTEHKLSKIDSSPYFVKQIRTEELGVYTESACEAETLKVSCSDNKQIEVLTAFYGRNSSSICPTSMDWQPCETTTVLKIASKICNFKETCNIEVKNKDLDGDPCENTQKYLTVSYPCVLETTKKNRTKDENKEGGGAPKLLPFQPIMTTIFITLLFLCFN